MNSNNEWIKDVRSSVKRAYGLGWVIEEQSGKVKILRRMPDGRRPAFITNLPFVPSSFSVLVELFAKGVKNMEELDKPFKEAFQLATISKPVSNNGKINWDEIAFKYKKSRVPNKISESNWQNNERSRIEKVCEILNADRNGVLVVKNVCKDIQHYI